MKKIKLLGINIATIAVLIIGFSGCAVKMASPELRDYQAFGNVKNTNKKDLYTKVNSWFVSTFVSAESVIEYQDKEAGIVMGNYVYDWNNGFIVFKVKQTIKIEVKDNKYRFSISDPYIRMSHGALSGERYKDSYRQLVDEEGVNNANIAWAKLETSLKKYLNKQTVAW